MHLLSDLMGPEPTFTLAGGRDVPYYNNLNSTVQVPRSVDSSSCLPPGLAPAASHEETMTASSDEEYDLYARRCRSSPWQADSLSGATINICESGTTLVKHITDPGPALTRTGGGGIEEICLYRDGSAVTPTYYGWNGPRHHCNTVTSSRRTQEARYNTNSRLVLATECPGEHENHRDGDSLSNLGETPTTPSSQPREEAIMIWRASVSRAPLRPPTTP